MSRSDQFDVTVTVKHSSLVPDLSLGTFDTFSGGEVDSEETKYWPGGLGQQISLGGRRTVGNVTVGRLYSLTNDHKNMAKLMGLAGRATVVVTKTSLTPDGVATGDPLVYTGKLKSVTPPDHDSESSDASTWEMEVSSASVTQNPPAPGA
jgi:hypothetical protein